MSYFWPLFTQANDDRGFQRALANCFRPHPSVLLRAPCCSPGGHGKKRGDDKENFGKTEKLPGDRQIK